jgi:hypothetical protein
MTYEVTAEQRNQVSQGLYAYCRGLDRFDRELALSPFADHAHLVYSGIFEGTASEFMDWIWPIHGRMRVHVHRVANVFIERNPDGDLVSESYVQVLLRTVADDGSITDNIGNGRYVDRWADRNGGLVIVERDFIRDVTRSYPHEQQDTSVMRPESNEAPLTWARDESDASYRLLRA